MPLKIGVLLSRRFLRILVITVDKNTAYSNAIKNLQGDETWKPSSFNKQTHQIHPRQCAVGGGRQVRLLSVQEKLFLILFYFKCYPTFNPLLEKTLGKKMVLPECQLDSTEAFLECLPNVKRVMIDGTEHPLARFQDSEAQQANYFGKNAMPTNILLPLMRRSRCWF